MTTRRRGWLIVFVLAACLASFWAGNHFERAEHRLEQRAGFEYAFANGVRYGLLAQALSPHETDLAALTRTAVRWYVIVHLVDSADDDSYQKSFQFRDNTVIKSARDEEEKPSIEVRP